MKLTRKQIFAAGLAVAAFAGAGAAIAASRPTAKDEQKAVINDAAKQLGVAPSKLQSALQQALVNQQPECLTKRIAGHTKSAAEFLLREPATGKKEPFSDPAAQHISDPLHGAAAIESRPIGHQHICPFAQVAHSLRGILLNNWTIGRSYRL